MLLMLLVSLMPLTLLTLFMMFMFLIVFLFIANGVNVVGVIFDCGVIIGACFVNVILVVL